MRYFILNSSGTLGMAIAEAMGVPVDAHEEREFTGGEHKYRPQVSVRGADVYVFSPLNADEWFSVNDKLIRLLFFIATCKENGARRVTALTPYLAYSRKDRQTKPRDPVTTQYVARLFEASRVDMVVTLDVHNHAAYQNAFRCATTHLNTERLFAKDIVARFGDRTPVFFSPDSGGVKRAQLLKEAYEAMTGRHAGLGLMEKRRSAGVVSGGLFAGDVDGADVVIVDDIINSGGTLLRTAKACRERGAARVYAYATHGLFDGDAAKVLADETFDKIIITDSTMPFNLPKEIQDSRIEVVSTASLFGEAIMRLHSGGSIHRLLDDGI